MRLCFLSSGKYSRFKRASEVLRPMLDTLSDKSVFLKMDCEGSEFSILRDLDEANLLDRIDGLAMEWHSFAGDPGDLKAILMRNGFAVFGHHEDNAELGLMMASRRRQEAG